MEILEKLVVKCQEEKISLIFQYYLEYPEKTYLVYQGMNKEMVVNRIYGYNSKQLEQLSENEEHIINLFLQQVEICRVGKDKRGYIVLSDIPIMNNEILGYYALDTLTNEIIFLEKKGDEFKKLNEGEYLATQRYFPFEIVRQFSAYYFCATQKFTQLDIITKM